MSGPVNVTSSFLDNARAAWGEAMPAWVQVLAEEAMRTSQTAVAKRLGYSVSVVSGVLASSYRGDLGKVEAKVRGAYMGDLVDCPVLGEIARDRCIEEQGRKFLATSALRTMLFRACRGDCPHSRIAKKEMADV